MTEYPLVQWETPLTSKQKDARRGRFYLWLMNTYPSTRRFLSRYFPHD